MLIDRISADLEAARKAGRLGEVHGLEQVVTLARAASRQPDDPTVIAILRRLIGRLDKAEIADETAGRLGAAQLEEEQLTLLERYCLPEA